MSHFISGDILIDWPILIDLLKILKLYEQTYKKMLPFHNMCEEQIGQNKGKDTVY